LVRTSIFRYWIFFLPLLMSSTLSAAEYITMTDAQLRNGPGANYTVIRTIPKDFKINVVRREGTWLRVESKHGNESGYIDERQARPLAAAAKSTTSSVSGSYITTGEVNLREGAGTKYKVLRRIPKGTRVNVVRAEGNWLRVESKTGNPPGYIDKRFARRVE
jgi:uncharacterized protein YraI